MKVVLITPPARVSEEIETLIEAFEEGLDLLHLRKPGWSTDEWIQYLEEIPDKWKGKMTIHGNSELAKKYSMRGIHLSSSASIEFPYDWQGSRSRSAHSVEEMGAQKNSFDYFFLSPVFDSISKAGYKSNFELDDLAKSLHLSRPYEVYALGGIDDSNIEKIAIAGFDGAAILGAFWQQESKKDKIEVLKRIIAKCKKTSGTY